MSGTPIDWRNHLRGDPAPWLLDAADNPSVCFWFLRDIVGRPEDATALIQLREVILYSVPVQSILAAQDESGFWDNPDSLTTPRYRATLWQLALLAELGVPRTSRRARTACEFVLQNHRSANGEFPGSADDAPVDLLLRTLGYFNFGDDPRVARAIDALAARIPTHAPGAAVFAVWTLTEIPLHRRSPIVTQAIALGQEIILNGLARGAFPTLGAFPSFDETDALLALRVLANLGRSNDPRANSTIEKIWTWQGENARWNLQKNLSVSVAGEMGDADAPSKWATLNVLRVVTKL